MAFEIQQLLLAGESETVEFKQSVGELHEIIATQIERLERWEYPLEALREAIINATCHRDYRDSGNVQVRIFDDRLEVWSPGLLPEASPSLISIVPTTLVRAIIA